MTCFLQEQFTEHTVLQSSKGPSTLATLFSHRWPRFCGGVIYSRRKPLFSSFGEHTAVCGSSVRQAVARPRHRQSVFVAACHFLIIIFYVAATCRPSVPASATKTRPPVATQSGQCAHALNLVFTWNMSLLIVLGFIHCEKKNMILGKVFKAVF